MGSAGRGSSALSDSTKCRPPAGGPFERDSSSKVWNGKVIFSFALNASDRSKMPSEITKEASLANRSNAKPNSPLSQSELNRPSEVCRKRLVDMRLLLQ